MAKVKQKESSLSSTGSGKNNSREDRKREQNRLSQRYLREKRKLRMRQAESMEEAIKYSTGAVTDDMTARISQLSTQLLQATARNKRLSEALLKMRNKFLSISASSNIAADDDVFNEILGIPSQTTPDIEAANLDVESEQETESLPAAIKSNSGGEQQASLPVYEKEPQQCIAENDDMNHDGFVPGDFQFETAADGTHQTQGIFDARPTTPWKRDNLQTNLGSNNQTPQIDEPWLVDHNSSMRQISQSMQGGFRTFLNDPQMALDLETSTTTGALIPVLDSPGDSNTSLLQLQQTCLTTQLVEETCIRYASQLSGTKMMANGFGRVPDSSRPSEPMAAVAVQQMPEKLVDDLIKVAVYLISLYAKVENYVYGIVSFIHLVVMSDDLSEGLKLIDEFDVEKGIDKVMESIIRWRISPSRDTSSAIPAPFCPTPLQAFGPAHHIMIDCCVWPSLRDQLILNYPAYDMDKLSSDMIRLTVLEIPYLKSAVNVMDLFFNSIIPQENGSGGDHPESESLWGLCGTSEKPRPDDLVQPLDRSLLSEISRRMSYGMPLDTHLDQIPSRSSLSAKLGLNNFHNWKLSKDFASKYPFLDCISAESKYSTITAATVLNVGLWVLDS